MKVKLQDVIDTINKAMAGHHQAGKVPHARSCQRTTPHSSLALALAPLHLSPTYHRRCFTHADRRAEPFLTVQIGTQGLPSDAIPGQSGADLGQPEEA
jgi:hypothetical protein